MPCPSRRAPMPFTNTQIIHLLPYNFTLMEKDNPNGLNFDSLGFIGFNDLSRTIYDADGNPKRIQEGMCGWSQVHCQIFKVYKDNPQDLINVECFSTIDGNKMDNYLQFLSCLVEIDPKDFDKIKRAHEGYMSVIKAVEKKYQQLFSSIPIPRPQFGIQGTTSIQHP